MARTQLLPQLGFTEDISRGNDPVYAFGTRLRQRQFTQADFALNALNFPQPIGNFSTRFSGSVDGVRFVQDAEGDPSRRSVQAKRLVLCAKRWTSRSCSVLWGPTSRCSMRSGRSMLPSMSRRRRRRLLTSVDEHVKAGLAVESDRMSAEVNVAARKEELIAAQGDLELAWAQLREAMGAPGTEGNRTEAD